ncbi:hypothetical protein YC2023_022184 [Brassica napus]
MVMMGGKKLGGNRVWSANRVYVVCREYKFSKKKGRTENMRSTRETYEGLIDEVQTRTEHQQPCPPTVNTICE